MSSVESISREKVECEYGVVSASLVGKFKELEADFKTSISESVHLEIVGGETSYDHVVAEAYTTLSQGAGHAKERTVRVGKRQRVKKPIKDYVSITIIGPKDKVDLFKTFLINNAEYLTGRGAKVAAS